ncbi:ABC transporter permease [Paenibacillus sp. CC-CFT747]|nr:ABC transporter permease [Paenibacillus sp. CC-CFT747]
MNAPVDLTSIQVDNGDGRTRSQMIVSYILVYALLILVSMMVYMYGNMIAMEITSEKSSRVMELLVSSISPVKQLYGKVLGTLLIGLLQIGVYVLVVVINLNLPHNASYFKGIDLDFGDAPPQLYGYFVLFFLLGFFLYAMLCAAVGSLVSRTEELGQAIAPITILALAGFYIGIFGTNAPSSEFVTVASFIPFFTPAVMFLRIGMANPAAWEVWLSIGVLVVTILFVGWLSAKIYRTGVLLYGKRPSFKEVRKAMQAFRA